MLLWLSGAVDGSSPEMHELVIRGGTVVDGTGAPAVDRRRRDRQRRRSPPSAQVAERGECDARRHGLVGACRVGSTSTRTTTARSPGTPRSRRRAGTASPPSSWATAASASRPCGPTDDDFLIELMEGVEDIPGTALHEGIDWEWESFPEYLDALDSTAARARHRRPGPARRAARLRAWASAPTTTPRDDEIAEMATARRARRSRPAPSASPRRARSCTARSTGSCPAPARRPTSCSRSATRSADAGHGVFQLIDDGSAGRRGRRVAWPSSPGGAGATVTYSLAQSRPRTRLAFRDALDDAADDAGRRAAHRPAGRVPADRDAVRAAVVAPPVHHPPDLPSTRRPAARRARGRAARSPRCAPRCSPRSRRPAARSPQCLMSALGPDLPARRSARLRAGSARRASPPSPSARAAAPRRSCSTGCSSATARRSCSPRSPATSTTTTRRSAR